MTQLLPKNEILLWKLLLTGEEPAKSQVKPKHSAKELKLLEESGLIEYKTVVEKGRRITRIALTDKAWDWASTTPPTAMAYSKSPAASVVLQKVLEILVAYSHRAKIALVDILKPAPFGESAVYNIGTESLQAVPNSSRQQDGVLTATPVSKPEALGMDLSLLERVFQVCEELGGRHHLVYLSDLRKRLPSILPQQLDQALLALDRQAKIVLMPLDDPLAITPEVDAAAIDLSGYKKHVLRVRN